MLRRKEESNSSPSQGCGTARLNETSSLANTQNFSAALHFNQEAAQECAENPLHAV